MKSVLKKTFLYLVLLLGFLLLYVFNVEDMIYKRDDKRVKSKIDFVYQQF